MLALAREWNEFKVSERTITMAQLQKASEENRIMEMFGAGTAAIVCPIDRIHYNDEDIMIPTMKHGAPLASRLKAELHDIQYGKIDHEWAYCAVGPEGEETINARSQ
jgi:branched-chain amino acid aminotransferase